MNNRTGYRVVEHFVSINGEGRRAGQLALFIRFAGCNLACLYCDTAWANGKGVKYDIFSVSEVLKMIEESKVKNVTLTGGEPLIQEGIGELIQALRQCPDIRVEIETNGSVDIRPFMTDLPEDNVSFTVDYKTGCSGMEAKMLADNYRYIRKNDTVKFVVGGIEDLETARIIADSYKLIEKGCGVYISPCFGTIEPKDIVNYIVSRNWNNVNVQLQLHKYIWDPNMRGV